MAANLPVCFLQASGLCHVSVLFASAILLSSFTFASFKFPVNLPVRGVSPAGEILHPRCLATEPTNVRTPKTSARQTTESTPSAVFRAVYRHSKPYVESRAIAVVFVLGLPLPDREDLAQELWLNLWIRLHRYDPGRSSVFTFSRLLIRNGAASIVDQQRMQRRDVRRCRRSLNEPVETENGRVELGDVVTHPKWTGRQAEALDLRVDFAKVQARLPAELAQLLGELAVADLSEIRRRTGYSRATLHRRIQKLRTYLTKAGLHKYLRRGSEVSRG